MIRRAKNVDIPAIVLLMHEFYAMSHYAKQGLVKVDPLEAKRLTFNAIQRHGHHGPGGCWVEVADNDGQVTGLMMATLGRVYAIGDMLCAQDLFWITNDRSRPTDGPKLLKNMLEWVDANPLVVETKICASGVVKDPDKAGMILKHNGFMDYGKLYRRDVRQAVEVAA